MALVPAEVLNNRLNISPSQISQSDIDRVRNTLYEASYHTGRSRLVPQLINNNSAANAANSDLAQQWAMLESQQDFNANEALLNRKFQQESADKAMAFSAEEAAKNRLFQKQSAKEAMEFSERMSNTSYQRAITDLKAAGLNPILAYSQGGSTSPTGVTSSGSSASGVASSGSTASSGLPSTSGMSNSKKTDLQFLQTIGNLVTSAAMLFAFV